MNVLIPSPIALKGHIKVELIKKNGVYRKLYDGKNTIQSGIAEGFRDMLDTAVVDIAMNSLFANDDVQPGSTEDGNDGIVVGATSPLPQTFLTTITTSETPANTYGKKWRGEIEFSDSRQISSVVLGHDYFDGTTVAFNTAYALYTAISQAVAASDRMVFNWEIYI